MKFPEHIGKIQIKEEVPKGAKMGMDESVGNARSTVSRVLFRNRELKLGEFALTHKLEGLGELTESSPRNSVRAIELTEFGV